MNTRQANADGRAAYLAGADRVVPRALLGSGPVGSTDLAIPRAWYAGWDAANLADDPEMMSYEPEDLP